MAELTWHDHLLVAILREIRQVLVELLSLDTLVSFLVSHPYLRPECLIVASSVKMA